MNGEILDIALTPEFDYYAGETRKAYEGIVDLDTCLRQVAFVKPRKNRPAYFVIHDRVARKGDIPSQFDWLMHSALPFEVEDNTVTLNGRNAWLKATFFTPRNVELDIKRTPYGEESVKRDYLSAHPAEKTPEAEFLVLIEVGKTGTEPRLESGVAFDEDVFYVNITDPVASKGDLIVLPHGETVIKGSWKIALDVTEEGLR